MTAGEGAGGNGAGQDSRPLVRESFFFGPEVIEDIQAKAELGRYRIRGYGTLRRLPSFDDLTFITSGMSRVPLEGYRERCSTETVLGARNASEPLRLETPIYISGMSYGALSASAKVALGRAATRMGTMTVTGDGGMLLAEREASRLLMYQVLPSRYGFDPDHLRAANALEIVIGQGAKPGTGGLLARAQGLGRDRRPARPAPGRGPAEPGPPPGLDGRRRPDDKDGGA